MGVKRERMKGNGVCPMCGKKFFQQRTQVFCQRECTLKWQAIKKRERREQEKAEEAQLKAEMDAYYRVRKQPAKSITQIQKEAQEAGLTYGQYVSQMGV